MTRKIAAFAALFITMQSQAKNLQLIESNPQSGFSIYRSGKPDLNDFKEVCAAGIREMMVLSGDAANHELRYRDQYCPDLKVIYNVNQNVKVPLSVEFLQTFERWVKEAQDNGKKIAFRCSCGCHRTGRLAAYYQMKYQHLTSTDAIAVMKKHGKWMIFHPELKPQVWAMEEYLLGRPCTQGRYCLRDHEAPVMASVEDFH